MAAFLVVATAMGSTLERQIRLCGLSHVKLPRGEWIVGHDGTCKELAERLKLLPTTEEPSAEGIVVEILAGRYHGYAEEDIWDFLTEFQRAGDSEELTDTSMATSLEDCQAAKRLDPHDYHTRAEWREAGWPDSDENYR